MCLHAARACGLTVCLSCTLSFSLFLFLSLFHGTVRDRGRMRHLSCGPLTKPSAQHATLSHLLWTVHDELRTRSCSVATSVRTPPLHTLSLLSSFLLFIWCSATHSLDSACACACAFHRSGLLCSFFSFSRHFSLPLFCLCSYSLFFLVLHLYLSVGVTLSPSTIASTDVPSCFLSFLFYLFLYCTSIRLPDCRVGRGLKPKKEASKALPSHATNTATAAHSTPQRATLKGALLDTHGTARAEQRTFPLFCSALDLAVLHHPPFTASLLLLWFSPLLPLCSPLFSLRISPSCS